MKNTWFHYSNIVWLCIITIWYGSAIIYHSQNVITRLDIFGSNTDLFVASLMIVFPLIKLISLKLNILYLKKISLIAIAVLWLVMSWFYYRSLTSNTSYVISIGMAGFCYIQLWRGDYHK